MKCPGVTLKYGHQNHDAKVTNFVTRLIKINPNQKQQKQKKYNREKRISREAQNKQNWLGTRNFFVLLALHKPLAYATGHYSHAYTECTGNKWDLIVIFYKKIYFIYTLFSSISDKLLVFVIKVHSKLLNESFY